MSVAEKVHTSSLRLSESERAVLRDRVARARLAAEEERKKRDDAKLPIDKFYPEDELLAAVVRLSDEERAAHLRRIEREEGAAEPRPSRTTGRPRGAVVNPQTDGRLKVDLPGALVGDGSEPWHGTIGGASNHCCACSRCREVWRAYQREWQRKKRAAESA